MDILAPRGGEILWLCNWIFFCLHLDETKLRFLRLKWVIYQAQKLRIFEDTVRTPPWKNNNFLLRRLKMRKFKQYYLKLRTDKNITMFMWYFILFWCFGKLKTHGMVRKFRRTVSIAKSVSCLYFLLCREKSNTKVS